MEEELQKRNTDCVYFLASPLTCKKGSECEYRHSESARLNPRDCWYWLSGNCLNPTCAFRHPPLDGRPEISFDRFHVPLSTPGAISKTNVPCYFYFNAYCTKGDACPFLHGPDGALPGLKPTKAASAGMDTQGFEKKSSGQIDGQIDTGPGSVEERHSLAVSKMVNIQLQSKDVGQVDASNNLIEHSPSPQISVPDCEEGAGKLLDPLPSVAHFVNNERPLLCSDQSSEEPAADCVEPEERWESSPGFDVLVDDGSDQLGYEDDAEYLLGHDGEAGRRLHHHLLNYDYEDQVRYDPMDFPSAGILYEKGVYDSYDCMEKNNLSEHVRRIPEHPRGRMLERKTSRRRKLMRRELEVDYRNGDLRDHLRKRKRDSHNTSFSSQKHGSSSHIIEGSRKRSMRQTGGRRLNGRLASEANSESESGLNGTNRPCRPRGSRSKHSRPRLGKERRKTNGRELPHISSEISRDVTLKSTDPTLESTAFTGPKTLAQIKEEKRRARINEDDIRNMGNPLCTYRCQGMPGDFQGPKPLSELIKHKKEKLGSENENVGFYHILS